MPNPRYKELWYSDVQCAQLAELARRTDGLGPYWVVEVGAWAGKSTVALANAVAPAVVHVVDHWHGQPEAPHTQRLAQERDIFAEFSENIRELTVGNVCVHRMDWAEFAARECNPLVRFVHLDDGHETEVVRAQIRFFWARLVPGGILAGDDWGWDSVRTAVVQELPSVQAAGNLWWRVK